MPQIKIVNQENTIACEKGSNLLEVLLNAGLFVDNPCNGAGVCGKCKVRLAGKKMGELTETEKKFLTEREQREHIRLSCVVSVEDDLEVELLCQERKHKVLTKGYVPVFEKDSWPDGYGIAVDIGTTTVVTALVDLKTGEELAHASMINAQKHFGLDVLTRITYEYQYGEEGIYKLQKAIVDSLNEMIAEVCRETLTEKEQIKEIHVAANCTMTHMLLGVDARSLGKTPYTPVFTEGQTVKASDIGIDAGEQTVLYCLPQVSAYIGADIVAGAYVCRLREQKGNTLFIDIGTNGEIVLAVDGRLLCCSCAAGPALEGMNISAGMRAAQGAIEDLRITPDGVELITIGNTEPAGLCGSGILAAVKELLQAGIVKETGVFIKPDTLPEEDYRRSLLRVNGTSREFVLSKKPELLVTQNDIRQVQLAKGAILSGFMTLLHKAGIAMKDLDRVMIAGQFGANLPAKSLIGVGILPEEVEDKLIYVGNASKTGAYMTLLSKKVKTEMETLATQMEYVELAETDGYEQLFSSCMMFP